MTGSRREDGAARPGSGEGDGGPATPSPRQPGLGEPTTLEAEGGDVGRRPDWDAESTLPEPADRVAAAGHAGPSRIGPYRLLRRVGAGGMGEVWEAEQVEPVRRRVALKLVQAGLSHGHFLSRFEAERQSLALMEHSAIARVFDAGASEQGQPYLVMEYVEGLPLTNFCDAERLGLDERLELFVRVCDGVQHAHEKTVLHRDLKPSNVLVLREDGVAHPKIIDFGLAKALGPSVPSSGVETVAGQYVGTPLYSSPEQLSGVPGAVDTRSDVYSLGVMLYELLASIRPFDVDDGSPASVDALRRRILAAEPARPSTRVSRLEGAEEPARRRRTQPSAWSRSLRGDLDWITMKALEREPARRYGSAAELAADLRRYLRDEPIEARPPSGLYRFRKFARRHRLTVAAALVATLSLLAAVAVSTHFAIGQSRARADAERQARIAAAVNAFLNDDLLLAASPDRLGREVTVREVVERAAGSVDERFADEPLVESEVRNTLGRTLLGLGEGDAAIAQFQAALDLRREELGPSGSPTIEAMANLSVALSNYGRFDEAIELGEEALARSREQGLDPSLVRELSEMLGNVYWRAQRFSEAEESFRAALEIIEAAAGGDRMDAYVARNGLAALYLETGRFDEAEPILEELVPVLRNELGDEHPNTLGVLGNLGVAQARNGKWDEAETTFREIVEISRRIYDEDHPDLVRNLGNLAVALVEAERFAEAEELLLEARSILVRKTEEHPNLPGTLDSLAAIYAETGELQRAVTTSAEALSTSRRVFGVDAAETFRITNNHASNLLAAERYREAASLLADAVTRARAALPAESHLLGLLLVRRGLSLGHLGHDEEAEELFAEGVRSLEAGLGAEHDVTARAVGRIAAFYEQARRPEAAARWRDRAD